jgi:predicted dinucleotide-binding enzyme
MTQASTATTKFAIIGLGQIGQVVATNLAKSKRPIIVVDRNPDKVQGLVTKFGDTIQPMELGAAIKAADIILFAVYFDAIKALFKQYASELIGKVLIDPSNAIAPDGKGGFVKTIGEKESAGQLLAAVLPANARLVKAFGSLGAGSLANGAYQQPDEAVLFYAADDKSLDPVIGELIRHSGFEPLRVGGIDQSIRIEVFGDLHEFGALGKTVTLAEAKPKVNVAAGVGAK